MSHELVSSMTYKIGCACLNTHICIVGMSSAFSQMIFACVAFLISANCSRVNDDGKPEFSNQKRSPRLMLAKLRATMHANVGPIKALNINTCTLIHEIIKIPIMQNVWFWEIFKRVITQVLHICVVLFVAIYF